MFENWYINNEMKKELYPWEKKEDWLIRASDMTVSERNTIYEAIMEVETEREKNGNYRKMFAYEFGKDWVNDISPCGIEEKLRRYHKTESEDKE